MKPETATGAVSTAFLEPFDSEITIDGKKTQLLFSNDSGGGGVGRLGQVGRLTVITVCAGGSRLVDTPIQLFQRIVPIASFFFWFFFERGQNLEHIYSHGSPLFIPSETTMVGTRLNRKLEIR